MSRRVLIVSVMFPPMGEPGSIRPMLMSRYLPRYGWEPVILTISESCARPYDASLLERVPPGLRVVRTGCRSPYMHSYSFRNMQASPWARRLHTPIHAIVRLLDRRIVPDPYVRWAERAAQVAECLHRDTPFDAVVACMSPWSMGIAARDISRRCGVPYVLDMRDPWTASPKDWRVRDFESERPLERELIAGASAFIANTRGQEKLHLDAFEDVLGGKTTVVTNSFDPESWTTVPAQRFDRFTMLFTGNLHRWVSLRGVFRALAELRRQRAIPEDELQLICYGTMEAAQQRMVEELGISNWVRLERRIPQKLLLPKLRGADLLVSTVGWWFAIPAKTFDYLAAGPPILMIGPREGDAVRAVLETGRGFAAEDDDVDRIAGVIRDAHAARKSGRPMALATDTDALARYSTPETARMMAECLDRVAAGRLPTRSAAHKGAPVVRNP